MSQMRNVVKRTINRSSQNCNINATELKSLLNPLLSPILNQIKVLNDAVSSLVNSLARREGQEFEKNNVISDFTAASIAADISMLATDTHRLSKCYENVMEQITDNKKSLSKLHDKMSNIEKLVGTLVKRQTIKRSWLDPKISDVLQHFEEYLLGKSVKSGNLDICNENESSRDEGKIGLESGHMQLLTLNGEEDFPQGSWLGDPNQQKLRVRCSLRDEDLVYINTKCTTPVKMALTLLDYLFPKETLSVSNLSGKGKLGKKQLDPLMIYGIKCHLMHFFNVNEKEWEKIKQNIDSKCRSAWKKRRLTPEWIAYDEVYPDDSISKDSLIEIPSTSVIREELERPKARVIRTINGDVEVLHASADQVLRFQDLHNYHVLDGDHILPISTSDGEDGEAEIQLSKYTEQSDLAIITEATDLASSDTVSFVMEPMLEVLTENGPLIADTGGLLEER